MKNFYLDFEKPISDIMDKIEALKIASEDDPKLIPEIEKLKSKEKNLRKRIFSKLSIWQKVQIARHPQRPHTKDYIDLIFRNFVELHGDRQYADDAAIIGGIGDIDNKSFMIIGHEKGRETEEKVKRNFGMPHPEGYRKAKRLMLLAERFSLPIISFIDTAGAYPGIEGEERGQSEAIASNLASKIYGLEIINDNIQTIKKNQTRFVILQKKGTTKNLNFNKASVKFELDHKRGSLAAILNVLSDCKLNLTKIQSMPKIQTPWRYSFFVDITFLPRL